MMPFRRLSPFLLVLAALALAACTQTINVYSADDPPVGPSVTATPQAESASPTMQHGQMGSADSKGAAAPGGMASSAIMGMMHQEMTDHEAMMEMMSSGSMDHAAMMEMMGKHGMDHDAMISMMEMQGMDDSAMAEMMAQAKMDHAAMMEMMSQGEIDVDAMMGMMQTHSMNHAAMMGAIAELDTGEETEQEEAMSHDQLADPALPFDAQFIDSMIEHHQGAVDMARLALEQAEHEELRTMAADIIEAQTAEIEQMQAWRAAWHPDLPPTAGMGLHMGDMAVSDDVAIPFDQRFLQAMISHHRGAITMAQAAQIQAEHDELKQLADAIIAAQETEISQMQAWLSEWYGIESAPVDAQGASDAPSEEQTDEHDTHQ